MQKLQKPQIRPPEGRHKFSAILESPKKPEPTEIRAFLLRAHEYGEEKLERTLKSVMCRPQLEISTEISGLITNPEQILFNPSTLITDVSELATATNGLIIGRNALIPHYLTSERFLKYFFRSYQEVCEALLSEKKPGLKGEYLRVLGVMGNLLPKAEKSKLVDFLVSVLDAETDEDNRWNSVQALTLLLSPKAVFPIMRSAEGAEEVEFEGVAYKSALILSTLGSMLPLALPNFLFGRYSVQAKTDAAFVMLSMGDPGFKRLVNYFAMEVESTKMLLEAAVVAELADSHGMARLRDAADYLNRFADESGFAHDAMALDAIRARLLGGSVFSGNC